MAITLRALRYFLRAVECRTIAAAAADLAVAPSAVSAAIDGIEATLGLTLVHRRRAKGLEPTASGLAIAARARAVLEDYETLLSFGAELQGALSGTLRIGYYAPVAPAFLPGIIAPLLQANPGVTTHLVECDTERAQHGLLTGEFDVILFVATTMQPGIDVVRLLETTPYLLVPEDDPLATAKSVSIRQLEGGRMVMLDLPVVRGYYSDLFSQTDDPPTVAATGTTHEMVRSLVGAGVGRAILNMVPHTDRTYAGDRVRALPLDCDAPPVTLALGRVGAQRRRLVDTFATDCQNFFAGPQAAGLVIG